MCLILRLLTRFPWLVSPQTLNELEGRDPGPHVQHGHVHVVTLEQALGLVVKCDPGPHVQHGHVHVVTLEQALGLVVKCSMVLSENQRVENSARRSSERPSQGQHSVEQVHGHVVCPVQVPAVKALHPGVPHLVLLLVGYLYRWVNYFGFKFCQN